MVVSPTAAVETMPEVLAVACTSTAYPSDTTAIELPSRERTPQTKTGAGAVDVGGAGVGCRCGGRI